MILVQLLFPLLARYPHEVAALVGRSLDQPVAVKSIDSHWEPSGPVLVLHGVTFGRHDGKPIMRVPRVRIKLDLGAWVSSARHWLDVRVEGLRLALMRDRDGRWRVAGLGAGQGGAVRPGLMLPPGTVSLADSRLTVTDSQSGHSYVLHVASMAVRSDGASLRFRGTLRRGDTNEQVSVAGHVTADGSSGRLWLDARQARWGSMLAGIDLHGYAIDSGQGDVAIWVRWQRGILDRVTARLALQNIVVANAGSLHYLPRLQGLAQFRSTGGDTGIVLASIDGAALRAQITGTGNEASARARLHAVDVAAWVPLVGLLPGLPDSLQHWLVAAKPHGTIDRASARWSRKGGLEGLRARFTGLGFDAVAGVPGMNHLDGKLLGDATAVTLQIPQQPLTLDFGGLFRQPLDFLAASGNVTAWHGARGWTIGSAGVRFDVPGADGTLRGRVRLHGASGLPFVALYVGLDHADVAQAHRYWPVGVMPRQTVAWLDQALVDGSIDSGNVVLRGNLADWPFTGHQGRFEARAVASGVTMDYQDGWPAATGVHAVASFVDSSMRIVASRGQVHGIAAKKAVASIPDLAKATLHLSVQGSGSGSDLLYFVRHSPIGRPHLDVLKGLALGGQGDVDFTLKIPLHHDAGAAPVLDGKIQLHGAKVADPAWTLQLGDVSGLLHFNTGGVSASGLRGTFHGQPVTLGFQVGQVAGHPGWPVEVSMHGRLSVAQLLAGYKSLEPLATMAQGDAEFDVGFHIDPKAANALRRSQVLSVRSNLVGVALDLPAPLDKPATTSLPLDVELGLPFDTMLVDVSMGTRAHARARLGAGGTLAAAGVALGPDASPMLPARGVRIRGQAQRVDISGWVRRLLPVAGGTSAAVPALDVDLLTNHAEIFGADFGKLALRVQTTTSGLGVATKGANLEMTATVPLQSASGRGIVANFARLYWPAASKEASSAQPSTTETPAQAANTGITPAALPAITAQIAHLRVGDAHLGEVQITTQPTAQGLRIAKLAVNSPAATINAHGQWDGTATHSSTRMQVQFDSADLGKALDAFGFKGVLTGGKTHANLDATWPGAPFSFALANLDGTVKMTMGEGRIPEISPGMGRLFGLLSVAELPRRLSLNFGDVFEKGLSFDSVAGSFTIRDGNARTQDFVLKGPSLDMHIKGRIGLRKQDYDQYVDVIPHVGGSLPLVGAVVGGPIGAAAGLAIQGLLGHSLNKTASVRYHVTGPWDNPQIEKVGAKPAATQPSGAGSTSASSSPDTAVQKPRRPTR